MPSLQGVLRESILSTISPEEEAARRERIIELEAPLKRVVALALHEVAIHFPGVIAPHVGLEKVTSSSTEFLDAGFDSLVFREGCQVLKVHKDSIDLPPDEQAMKVLRRNRLHGIMHSALPDFTLPQETDLGFHPLYQNVPAVVTRQDYQDSIYDTALFTAVDTVDPERLRGLSSSPAILTQLREFTAASRRLYVERGLMPDLWGRSNLVISGIGSLVMIDGHPLDEKADDTFALNASLHRLASLEGELAEVA